MGASVPQGEVGKAVGGVSNSRPGVARCLTCSRQRSALLQSRLKHTACGLTHSLSPLLLFHMLQPPLQFDFGEDIPYSAAAELAQSYVNNQLAELCQQQKALTLQHLVTVPGCVLLLMDLVQAAGSDQHDSQVSHLQQPQSPHVMVLRTGPSKTQLAVSTSGAWQMQLGAPSHAVSKQPGVASMPADAAAEPAAADAATPTQQEVLQQVMKALLTEVRQGQLSAGAAGVTPATLLAVPAHTSGVRGLDALQPQQQQHRLLYGAVPTSTYVIGSWGQDIVIQLVTPQQCGPVTGDTYQSDFPPAAADKQLWGELRVVVAQHRSAVTDETVQLKGTGTTAAEGSGGGRYLTVNVSPQLAAGDTTAAPSRSMSSNTADCVMPGVFSMHLMPKAARAGATPASSNSAGSAAASLPSPAVGALAAWHVTLLVLPATAAEELAHWVAARQLSAHEVAAWGSDLAMLLSTAQQLRDACASSSLAAPSRNTSSSGGSDLVRVSQLAVAAAVHLEQYFLSQGLAAAADVVVVAQQVVMMAARQLQRSAGDVTAAAEAADAPAIAGVAPVHIAILGHVGLPTPPGGAMTSPAAPRSTSLVPQAGPAQLAVAPQAAGPSMTSSGAPAKATSCQEDPPAEWGSKPSSSGPSSKRAATAALSATDGPGSAGVVVSPADVEALMAGGWGAWVLSWKGFRGAEVEGSFQVFRSSYLRGWDWVCRVYNAVLNLLLVLQKLQQPGVALLSWSGIPRE